MFDFLKPDQIKKLQKEYERKQTAARNLQRSGDIQAFAQMTAEADAVYRKILLLERNKNEKKRS